MNHPWLAVIHLLAGFTVGFMAATMTIKVHVQSRDHLRGLIMAGALMVLSAVSAVMVAIGWRYR